MPITITQATPGMPAEMYDQIIGGLGEPLHKADGFISHTAQVTPEGILVSEVWESREQWQAWYDQAVRPHLPPGAPEPEVTDMHNAIGR